LVKVLENCEVVPMMQLDLYVFSVLFQIFEEKNILNGFYFLIAEKNRLYVTYGLFTALLVFRVAQL